MSKVDHRLIQILLRDKTSIKFAVGVTIGLAFSISVILCTIGIMDGFVNSLTKGLKRATGDIILYSHEGFFEMSDTLQGHFDDLKLSESARVIQTEGFAIAEDHSKGVLVKGIEPVEFERVTSLKLSLYKDEVAIGTELAQFLKIKEGDELVLALASGNKDFTGLPTLHRYKITRLVSHDIYEKDMRLVYMNIKTLQDLLGVGQKINILILNIPMSKELLQTNSVQHHDSVNDMIDRLYERVGFEYSVRPFWREFSSLIKAVKVEKFMIGLILQLVVIISVFNVLAFIIFLNEKKAQQIFLFKALGMSQKSLAKVWLKLVLFLWVSSCLFSFVFLFMFKLALRKLPFLQLPGEIYHLGQLEMLLTVNNYFLVFFLALIWLALVSWFALNRLKKSSILHGLRKEFA